MLVTIQRYYLFLTTLLIAAIAYLAYRRGQTIGELQQQIILGKVNQQLNDALTMDKGDQDAFNQAISKYRDLRSHYNSFYGNYPSSGPSQTTKT